MKSCKNHSSIFDEIFLSVWFRDVTLTGAADRKFLALTQKKKILSKSVHPVHLSFLLIIIIYLSGDHLNLYYSLLFTRG